MSFEAEVIIGSRLIRPVGQHLIGEGDVDEARPGDFGIGYFVIGDHGRGDCSCYLPRGPSGLLRRSHGPVALELSQLRKLGGEDFSQLHRQPEIGEGLARQIGQM